MAFYLSNWSTLASPQAIDSFGGGDGDHGWGTGYTVTTGRHDNRTHGATLGCTDRGAVVSGRRRDRR